MLMLMSLVLCLSHKCEPGLRKTNMFVFLVLMLMVMLMLMLMRKLEQYQTNKWVRPSYVSAYAYAYVAGVLTCL